MMIRKRIILILGLVGFLLGSGWLCWHLRQEPAAPEPLCITLPDESAQIEFLAQHGFPESRCASAEAVQLPAAVDAAYADYAALQRAQQLPLEDFLGCAGTRYTYTSEASAHCTELLLDSSGRLLGAMQYDRTDPLSTCAPLW